MLTFLSRSLLELVDAVRGRLPAQPPARVRLHLVPSTPDHDTAVTAVLKVGAAATFVAGQGARIYSLDAFRNQRGPRHPRVA